MALKPRVMARGSPESQPTRGRVVTPPSTGRGKSLLNRPIKAMARNEATPQGIKKRTMPMVVRSPLPPLKRRNMGQL